MIRQVILEVFIAKHDKHRLDIGTRTRNVIRLYLSGDTVRVGQSSDLEGDSGDSTWSTSLLAETQCPARPTFQLFVLSAEKPNFYREIFAKILLNSSTITLEEILISANYGFEELCS